MKRATPIWSDSTRSGALAARGPGLALVGRARAGVTPQRPQLRAGISLPGELLCRGMNSRPPGLDASPAAATDEARDARANEEQAQRAASLLEETSPSLTQRCRAEETVQKSEDDLRQAIDTIPALAWSALPDGGLDYLNKRWIDYTGLRLEQATGWGWQAAIHPDDLPGLAAYWNSILTAGTAGEYEARLRRHDGAFRWFLFRGVPLRDERGQIVKWYGTNSDIEDRRASEHLASGQMESLTSTLDALSRESEPEKFLEHVLRAIGKRLGAHSIGVWEMNAGAGRVQLVGNCEGDRLHLATKEQRQASPQVPLVHREHPVWTDFFRTGRYCVFGEIEGGQCRVRTLDGADSPWHDWNVDVAADPIVPPMLQRLSAAGVSSTLSVPMFVAGKVTGFLSIRFQQRQMLVCREIELTRALAHQAMLAIQLMRLSRESRHAAVAAERNRMAREIHDTLAQGFTGVIVQLEAATDAASRGLAREAEEHIERARELARHGLGEARRSVRALRPRLLEDRDLCAALNELVLTTAADTNLRAGFAMHGVPRPLPLEWDDNLLRIAQEVLTNALRHARATQFTVEMMFADSEVRIELRDNGCGFDPAGHHDGFGLIGIRERVSGMGGDLRIESEIARGTAIAIVLPFAALT